MTSSLETKGNVLAQALRRRAALAARGDLTAYRLVNGAADGTPGLAIDRYADVAIVHADSTDVLANWREALDAALPLQTAYAKVHPPQASRLGNIERLAPDAPLWGNARDSVEVVEYDVRYEIRTGVGLSVGLFLDMRDVRAWLRGNAKGKRVLNLFAYTCAFGVCASRGGATRVLNVDLSRVYLGWGKRNYRLNGVSADDHDFVFGDAVDWLHRFARRSETFDIVIVDPPSFSSTRERTFSVERDYVSLATLAARVTAPAGILLAATNHAGTSDRRFESWLHAALHDARRHGDLAGRWHEPELDFPVPDGRPPYLKVRAVQLT